VQDRAEKVGPIERTLESMGFQVANVVAIQNALPLVRELDCEFVLWESGSVGPEDIEALECLKRNCPKLPVVVLAEIASPEIVIELIKAGAHDVVAAPLSETHLENTVRRSLESRRLLCDACLIRGHGQAKGDMRRLVGQSPAMQTVYKQIGLVAARDEPVLLCGETGTGKELIARAIHRHSSRSNRPFHGVNCAAVPESLLESELFGYEKGAFTGSVQRRLGAFERANGGTLLLDEVADMSLSLQAKVLRVLQQGEIQRLGGDQVVHVDVRVIAATNTLLDRAIQEGRFRKDLYYRLLVVAIHAPALREHTEDILELASYFIERYTPPEKSRPALDKPALDKLTAYPWPGNVRELENAIRRALVFARGDAILEKDILLGEAADAAGSGLTEPTSFNSEDSATYSSAETNLDHALEAWLRSTRSSSPPANRSIAAQIEAKLLRVALHSTAGNQVRAADLLGISRSTLREWMKKYASTS
jgi:DNA-binding NtrC family response regulator